MSEEKRIEEMIVKKSVVQASGFIRKKTAVLLFMMLIFIVIIIFMVLKIFNKNSKQYMPVMEKKDEVVKAQEKQSQIPGTDAATVKTGESKPVQKEMKVHDNEYLVKENDNLIKISQELYNDYRKWQDIYNMNKDKLDRPSVIFPGQVLILPEKQNK